MPRFGSKLPKMDDVFKSHPKPDVVADLLAAQRLRAIDILQNVFPGKILHMQSLIEQEQDPTSPFYHGHVFQPPYTGPMIAQPAADGQGHGVVAGPKVGESGDLNLNLGEEKVVMPNEVASATLSAGGHEHDENKSTKLGAHWFEIVPTNPVQLECIQIVTKELEELHMLAQDLRAWLELEIPLVEDGNSFGADVQAHLNSQLTDAYKKSNSMQNGVRTHHTDRLKLSMDWAKYPNLRDFAAAIAANDRFDHFLLRSYLRSILTLYSGLLTKFEKNWPKVINPKGSHEVGGMY